MLVCTNLPVTITGNFTHFSTSSVVTFIHSTNMVVPIGGTGITAGAPTSATATSLTVPVTIAPNAPIGIQGILITTGTETVPLLSAFTVNAVPTVITQLNPNAGQQGQSGLPVTITGQNTHFTNSSVIDLGTGITASSVAATDATHLTAQLTISATAPLGFHNLTVTTGGEVVTLPNAFTVTTSSAPVITSVTPNTGQQGQQNESVVLTGQLTHWTQGTTTASFGAGITVASLTVNSPTSATAIVNIDPAAATGARTLTMTTGSEVETLTNGFTVNPGTPVITQVNPNTGQQGQQNLSVNLTGQFTHWVQGTTTANFGAGITVASLVVNSTTSATAVLNIDPAALVGTRTVTITTSTEVVSLSNGFTVQVATAVPITVNPNQGQQGQTIANVIITGSGTHFVQGTTQARFGPSVMVGSGIAGDFGPVTVTSSTSATAQITIFTSALPAARTVTVQTG